MCASWSAGESLAQRLDEKYLEHWKEARNDVTNHGRLPAGLRDMNSALHDGHGLGDHFPLTGNESRLYTPGLFAVLAACHGIAATS